MEHFVEKRPVEFGNGNETPALSSIMRVAVIGTSCAGKTTFARSLARLLGFPHIELDALHWLPNWIERPDGEFRALTARATSEDYWVLDGNYAVVRDLVWSRATTLVWLNYSFPTVLWLALTRTLRRSVTKEEIFAGNRESLRMALLSRDSILWWVVSTFYPGRKRYRELFDAATLPQLDYLEFRKPSDAQVFLSQFNNND